MNLQVKELWRYPVKSMGGERLTEAALTERGLLHDRGWAVRQEASTTIRGAKHLGALLQCSARYPADVAGLEPAAAAPAAEITLPDGRAVMTDDPKVNGLLSEVVGEAVTLWPLQPAENEDHYRLNALEPGTFQAELRRIMALRDDEPLPDLSGFPPHLSRQLTKFAAPPGTYFDAFAVNILTEASLRRLQALMPDSRIDVRRFRPNILIADDQGETSLLEDSWIGRALAFAEAEVEVIMGCPRCIMVTRPQADLPQDSTIMRTLVRETGQSVSVYGQTLTAGAIRVGEPVSVR